MAPDNFMWGVRQTPRNNLSEIPGNAMPLHSGGPGPPVPVFDWELQRWLTFWPPGLAPAGTNHTNAWLRDLEARPLVDTQALGIR